MSWFDLISGHMFAKLGDGFGAGGTTVQLPSPSGSSEARDSAVITRGNSLVLATNWFRIQGGVTGIWATVVNPCG